jgi:S-disulfanyl-L-cysteine oxidoreductase SoxD
MRILIGLCTVALVAQTSGSVWDGVYTTAQADRGKAVYAMACASCHGSALDGSGAAPPLAGMDFKSDWNGQTLNDLFDKMQTTMPADNPGSMSKQQTADVLAFVLATNQFPAGAKELPADAATLGKIRFEAAKPK